MTEKTKRDILRENVPVWQYQIDAIASTLAYQMDRELSLVRMALDGYKLSSAPGLEGVIKAKEEEILKIEEILEGLR